MIYYHIKIEFKDEPYGTQLLTDQENLELIKKGFLFPYYKGEENFTFDGKQINKETVREFAIYKSDRKYAEFSEEYMNIKRSMQQAHFCMNYFSLDERNYAENITGSIETEVKSTIEKEEKIEQETSSKTPTWKIILYILFALFVLYSVLCFFPCMDAFNIYNKMNLEGNTAKIWGAIATTILGWEALEKFFFKKK